MGITQSHALGRCRQFYAETEPTAGTFVKPTAAGAARVIDSQMDLQIERKDRVDARCTRSSVDGTERITGKGTISWSVNSYLMPSGTRGTPPDLHELYHAALGTYANDVGASDTYSPSDSQTCRTVSMAHKFNGASDGVMMEAVWGAWVNSISINSSGGDEPKVAFEGGAMGYAFTGNTTLDAATSGADGDFQVQPGGTRAISVNSVVQIGSETNTAAGFQVDIVDHTTYTHTCTGDVIPVVADDSAVIPYVPVPTIAGTPIAGITGSLSMDSTEYPITAFDVTVANGLKPLDDQAFKQYPDDIIPGFREVTGNIAIRARKDLVIEMGKREAFATRDIAVVLGSGAGTTCTININQAEIMFAAATFPEAEEGTISLPFKALATTTTAANEIDIAFT